MGDCLFKVGQWIYGIKINEEDIEESELCGYLYMGECGDYIICAREDGDYLEDFNSQLLNMYRECCEKYNGTYVHLLKRELVFEEYENALEKLNKLTWLKGETMFIKTQNKDSIINLQSVNQISINSGYTMEKIEIKAYFSDKTYARLGGYKDPERAKEVLKDICSSYENSCYCNDGFDSAAQIQRPYLFMRNNVYQMPTE